MAQICASCGAETDAPETCDACEGPVLLDGGIRLEEKLGRGDRGRTYRARRLADRQVVCVERFVRPVSLVVEVAEVFEREARGLCGLEHEGVVDYTDVCRVEGDDEVSFYLVREWVSGGGLDAEMEEQPYDVFEVLGVLEELAETLEYLHGEEPPVVHGDIQPSNVMRRRTGELALVDVGTVERAVDEAASDRCVSRHSAYAAPEQRRGDIEPRSDLYGLGALGVVLVAGGEPEALEEAAGRPDWEGAGDVPEPCRSLLEELLAPEPEGRPADAAGVGERIGEVREELTRQASSSGWFSGSEEEDSEVSADVHRRRADAVSYDPRPVASAEEPTEADPEDHAPSAWWMLGVGLVAIAVILGARALGLFGIEKTAGVPIADHVCQGTACRGLEESSLDQFAFGTSVDAMRGEGRELVEGSSEGESGETVYRTLETIEGREVACELQFRGPDGGLSRFRCELPSGGDELRAHKKTVRHLLRRWLGRYGRPAMMEGPDDASSPLADETFSGTWVWRGPGGRLELRSRFRGASRVHRLGREAMDEADVGIVREFGGEDENEGGRIVIEHREGQK